MIPVSTFIQILNMSLGAAWAAILVMALRLLLRRCSHSCSYALWGLVLFRLVCPVSFSSVLSLMPRPRIIPQEIIYAARPQVESGFVWFDRTVSAALPPATPQASANPVQIWLEIGNLLWQAGVVVLLLYCLLSYLHFLGKLRGAVLVGEPGPKGGIWESDRIPTAFVLGLFRPRIYLPKGVGEEDRSYILCHEKAHIRRLDHIVKPLTLLLLTVHWFNPVLWLVYFLMRRDMEMSCDERALKELGENNRKGYSACLLSLSARQSGLAIPLAFGESDVKSRIKNVLSYKQPALWVTVTAVLLAVMLGFCLLSNPREEIGAEPVTGPGGGGEMELLTQPDRSSDYYTAFQEVIDASSLDKFYGHRAQVATQLAALLLSGEETDLPTLPDALVLTDFLRIEIRDPENLYLLYRYQDKYFMTKAGDYTLEMTQDTYDQIRSVYLNAAQEDIRASALSFRAEGEMADIARAGIEQYYGAFLGEKIPEELRLLSFTINEITPQAGTLEEFLVDLRWDYDTGETTTWISANGDSRRTDNGWRWIDCRSEFRFRRVGDDQYAIVGVGTGGGGQGLEPIA